MEGNNYPAPVALQWKKERDDFERQLKAQDPTAFVPFPKIARLNRECIITEKLDGTNASIQISDDGTIIRAGSRTRWITPTDDNYGFAKWVEANKDELLQLGPGTHFGEWWGSGIQRTYGLKEKRFSLFNTHRWSDPTSRPTCVDVVPVLYQGIFDTVKVNSIVRELNVLGSRAVPGFMKPEGIVVFHVPQAHLYKVTCEKDESPKGMAT
jgi:hypothetical protein